MDPELQQALPALEQGMTARMVGEIRAAETRMRDHVEATVRASAEETRRETVALVRASAEETRRHMGVLVEGLRGDFRVATEGIDPLGRPRPR